MARTGRLELPTPENIDFKQNNAIAICSLLHCPMVSWTGSSCGYSVHFLVNPSLPSLSDADPDLRTRSGYVCALLVNERCNTDISRIREYNCIMTYNILVTSGNF